VPDESRELLGPSGVFPISILPQNAGFFGTGCPARPPPFNSVHSVHFAREAYPSMK
jgi:hypothetical protein